jgi:hypothetical protein
MENNMDVQDFINSVATGNAAEAKDTLNNLLSARAFEALETKKVEIAQTLFGGYQVEEEVELTQEEFDQLDELTGKGQLPAIKKSHADAASAAGSKMDTIRNSNFKLPVPKEKTSKIYGLASAKQYHTHQSARAGALMKKAGIKE